MVLKSIILHGNDKPYEEVMQVTLALKEFVNYIVTT